MNRKKLEVVRGDGVSFPSIKEAVKSVDGNYSNLAEALRKGQDYKGYSWVYVKPREFSPLTEKQLDNKLRNLVRRAGRKVRKRKRIYYLSDEGGEVGFEALVLVNYLENLLRESFSRPGDMEVSVTGSVS